MPNQFNKASVIANYFDVASVILSYFVYFMLWRQIKVALNNGTANAQKKRTLEQGISLVNEGIRVSNMWKFEQWMYYPARKKSSEKKLG